MVVIYCYLEKTMELAPNPLKLLPPIGNALYDFKTE